MKKLKKNSYLNQSPNTIEAYRACEGCHCGCGYNDTAANDASDTGGTEKI